MKKAVYVAVLLAMTICGFAGTTAWAAEEPVELTAFERQITENLAEHQFMKTVQVGVPEVRLLHGHGGFLPIDLEAAPYINGDGVLMVAAEDVGAFLGWGKTRPEHYLDKNRKFITTQVENTVEWDGDTGKIQIEVPWIAAINFSVAQDSPYAPYTVPYEEGEKIEPWEGPFTEEDGKKYKIGKAYIEMEVGSDIWWYRGYPYTARTSCEERDGRGYLPIKEIHQTLLPYSQYDWDAESKTLGIVEGYRE